MDEDESLDLSDFAEKLQELDPQERENALWDKIASLQGMPCKTSGRGEREGVPFTYTVRRDKSGAWCGELFVSTKEKSLTKATVMKAYWKAVELGGIVTGPKKLGTFGASYLYSIFKKLGVIRPSEKPGRRGPAVREGVDGQMIIADFEF